jgi:hypothetical protein
MISDHHLLEKFRSLSQRYQALQKQFRIFAGKSSHAFAYDHSRISGISCESHSGQNYFDILFLGVRWRFSFTLQVEGDELSKGVVSCTRQPAPDSDERILQVSHFTFDHNGLTDQEEQSTGDTMGFADELSVSCLILNCINDGLLRIQKNPHATTRSA